MKYYSQKYQNTKQDFYDIHHFLKQLTFLLGPQVWEFVRFEFWQVAEALFSNDPNFLVNNACLWRDEEGILRGIFISEKGDNSFNLLVDPNHQILNDIIIDYAINSWGINKEVLETDAYNHTLEKDYLIKAGFKIDGQLGNTRKYNLENMSFNIALEVGFNFQSINETRLLEKCHSIHRTFNPNKPFEGKGNMTYWRKDLPSYNKELDLSIVSPSGEHVSFCYGFIDKEHDIAIIETIGTLPEYRKRGFGKIVIQECFRRLKEQGVKIAYITGFSKEANALYQSLGPEEVYPFFKYVLNKEA